jgi:hypothetical protein
MFSVTLNKASLHWMALAWLLWAAGDVFSQVIPSPSTTMVSSSQNPAAAGSALTFTTTVSGNGGVPTGTVVFFDGNNNLGSGTLDSSGVAALSTSELSVAGSPHAITTVYSGDSTFAGSSSPMLFQIITNTTMLNSDTNGALWELSQSLAFPNVPNAVLRPTMTNSVMGVDEMPSGNPADAGDGIVWHDWCLEDCFLNNEVIVHVIHAASHPNFMEISSSVYDGGVPLPLMFGQGNGNVSSTTFAAGISDYVFYAYGGIGGVTDGSSAAAGIVGETMSSSLSQASANSLTSGLTANITTINLTAGDWDVKGVASFNITNGTVTSSACGISVLSAMQPTDGSSVASGLQLTATSVVNSIPIQRKQINVRSTTTVYLVGTCFFSAGNVSAFGQIVARRIR